MSRPETVVVRLDRLIRAAIERGDYDSPAAVLRAAELSTGWLAELRGRCLQNPSATIRMSTAARLADVLKVGVSALVGGRQRTISATLENDPYPNRGKAVAAARALGLSEGAIGIVQAEDPGNDQPRMYWFRRIETEAERHAPAAHGSGLGGKRRGDE